MIIGIKDMGPWTLNLHVNFNCEALGSLTVKVLIKDLSFIEKNQQLGREMEASIGQAWCTLFP